MKALATLLFTAFSLSTVPAFAEGLNVWTNTENELFASSFELEILTNKDDARVFWTVLPDASPAEGLMYSTPIEIDRTETVYFFAFTPEPDVEYTPVKKQTFFVESQTGYEHLRIVGVDAASKTVTLKNFSRFEVKGDGWKLASRRGEAVLDGIRLEPGKSVTVKLAMRSAAPRITLTAPNGNIEQLASLPVLNAEETWSCADRRSASCGVKKE